MFDDNTAAQPAPDAAPVTTPAAADPIAQPVAPPPAAPAAGVPPIDPIAASTAAFNTTPADTAPVETPPAADPIAAPAESTMPPLDTTVPSPDPVSSSSPAPGGDSDLVDLKQQALQSLSPLLGQLDQSPEEKFRTTMMMIQASDNQALIKDAYEAAQAITDEKAKAQALLDVVNEINYFTQHPSS